MVKGCGGDVQQTAATIQAKLPEDSRWSKVDLERLLTRAYKGLASQITSPITPPITAQQTNLTLPGGVTVANKFTCRACNITCTTQKDVHDHCYSG